MTNNIDDIHGSRKLINDWYYQNMTSYNKDKNMETVNVDKTQNICGNGGYITLDLQGTTFQFLEDNKKHQVVYENRIKTEVKSGGSIKLVETYEENSSDKRITALEQNLAVATDLIEKCIKTNQILLEENDKEVTYLKRKVNKIIGVISIAINNSTTYGIFDYLRKYFKDFDDPSEQIKLNMGKPYGPGMEAYEAYEKLRQKKDKINIAIEKGLLSVDDLREEYGTPSIEGHTGKDIIKFKEHLDETGMFVKTDKSNSNEKLSGIGGWIARESEGNQYTVPKPEFKACSKMINNVQESDKSKQETKVPTEVCKKCMLGFTEKAPKSEKNPEYCIFCCENK